MFFYSASVFFSFSISALSFLHRSFRLLSLSLFNNFGPFSVWFFCLAPLYLLLFFPCLLLTHTWLSLSWFMLILLHLLGSVSPLNNTLTMFASSSFYTHRQLFIYNYSDCTMKSFQLPTSLYSLWESVTILVTVCSRKTSHLLFIIIDFWPF